MMLKRALLLVAVFTLFGCGGETAAQRAADDAHDVAMVERMSREPFKPIVPDTITTSDIERYGLDKPGCRFSKASDEPLFIATSAEGYMRVGPDLKRFSVKGGSADLPSGARTTYVGLSSWVDVVRQPDSTSGIASDQETWPARLIVHDAQDRVAFRADGIMRCD